MVNTKGKASKGAVVTVSRTGSRRPKKTKEKTAVKHASPVAFGCDALDLSTINKDAILFDRIRIADVNGPIAVFWVLEPQRVNGHFVMELRYALHKTATREESFSESYCFKEENILGFIPEGIKSHPSDYAVLVSEAIKKRNLAKETILGIIHNETFICVGRGSHAIKCNCLETLLNKDKGIKKAMKSFVFWNVTLNVMLNAERYL